MLTQARLCELLDYDPATGVFTWKAWRGRCCKVGRRAGSFDSHGGYWLICIDGRNYRAHRLAWLYTHGTLPDVILDHANNVPTDNTLANLRPATWTDNRANSKKPSNNTTGYKGVTFDGKRNKFRAVIRKNKQQTHLGYFDTAVAAYMAYVDAARRDFGQFARVA